MGWQAGGVDETRWSVVSSRGNSGSWGGIEMVPNPDWEVKEEISEGDSTFPGTEVTSSCHSGRQQRAFSYRQMSKIPVASRGYQAQRTTSLVVLQHGIIVMCEDW